MKIQGKPRNASAETTDTKKRQGPSADRRFAGKLHRQEKLMKKAEETIDNSALASLSGKKDSANIAPFQGKAVSETQAPGVPQRIQELVQEIRVRLEPNGPSQVEIQFGSQVFDGLRVNIIKEAGKVAIHFATANEAGAQFLSAHIPALSTALTSKGIAVGSITLNESRDSKSRGSAAGNASGRQRRHK
jgi:flagellar hook-length control protein FliK